MTNETQVMPAVALRGITILPDMIVHFDVSRKKSIRAIEEAMTKDQRIFLITQKDPKVEEPSEDDLYKIGTVAMIKQVAKAPKDMLRVLVEGMERAELMQLEDGTSYLEAEVDVLEQEEENLPDTVKEAMLLSMRELFSVYCKENQKMNQEQVRQTLEIDDITDLVDHIAVNIPLTFKQRQQILESTSFSERYEILGVILSNEIEVMRLRTEIQEKVKQQIDKNQRDYILREQLKLIREELGEDDTVSDGDHFMQEAEKLQAPKEIKERLIKEIRRFKSLGYNNSESSVSRGYIETLLKLPWEKASRDNRNLDKASQILEADHYGLEKVKERVLEFLAVRTLTKKGSSPILCLVGPPGTGKTSIARSVARSLNKKYVRISLGGVRDEAEIRGHRRTYVGAMPGRIANGLIQAGVKNPLMLLDEIDKVSSDYKGDTASALLEVLDSEQNSKFADHYVDLPLDLSEVLFIATANDPQSIPRPLMDRMEVIEISSYTENEKEHIAREHLIPKQIKANGLKESQLVIGDEVLKDIIEGYTKEAGVRNLERKFGEICRKSARKILQEKEKQVVITKDNLEDFLGRSRYTYQKVNEKDEVGIVRGLAWTSVGGDTLQIEVNLMPGKGDFLLTGQLGDVMKESAQAGISYIRSVADRYGIKPEFFKEHDLHIHIPEGAVPKDGPSAGITMATAMLSAITGRAVRANLAMTGEITLRGRVLPIGGLKEKMLAAKYAGITKILVPDQNRPDVEEIDGEIKDDLTIVFVEKMEQVLKEALV